MWLIEVVISLHASPQVQLLASVGTVRLHNVLPAVSSTWTFSPWTSGSTRLGGRQEIGTFGIKSSVRQCSTLEFTNKEGIINQKFIQSHYDLRKIWQKRTWALFKKTAQIKAKSTYCCHTKNSKPESVNALIREWSPIQDSVFGRLGALRLHRTQPFVVGDSIWRCWILSLFCREFGPHVRRTWVLLSVGLSTIDMRTIAHTQHFNR